MNVHQSINAETGRKLRALRLRAHLSMRELARQAGVAVSYVSNVEAGRVSATLATLRKLLVALGSDLGPFLSSEQVAPQGLVFRRQQMQATSDVGRSYTFILPSRGDIRFIMLDEELFAGEYPEFEALDGDLAGYVLAGELVLELRGEKPQTLQAGDAFYVPAGTPVRGCCSSGESVRLVTVAMQQDHPRLRSRLAAGKAPSRASSRRAQALDQTSHKSKSRRKTTNQSTP